MENTTALILVEGMSCGHCAASIQKAVGELAGVSQVQVDLATKTVAVTYDPTRVAPAALNQAITNQGFQVL